MPVLWRWITVASSLTPTPNKYRIRLGGDYGRLKSLCLRLPPRSGWFFVSSGLTTGRWGIGVLRRHGRRIHVRRVQSVGFAPLLDPIG